MVEDIEDRSFFVDTYLHPIEHRYVPNEHTEADGDKEERLKLISDGQEDEEQTHQDHDEVPHRCIRYSREGIERLHILNQKAPEGGHS